MTTILRRLMPNVSSLKLRVLVKITYRYNDYVCGTYLETDGIVNKKILAETGKCLKKESSSSMLGITSVSAETAQFIVEIIHYIDLRIQETRKMRDKTHNKHEAQFKTVNL